MTEFYAFANESPFLTFFLAYLSAHVIIATINSIMGIFR